jgi:hypothetical protein
LSYSNDVFLAKRRVNIETKIHLFLAVVALESKILVYNQHTPRETWKLEQGNSSESSSNSCGSEISTDRNRNKRLRLDSQKVVFRIHVLTVLLFVSTLRFLSIFVLSFLFSVDCSSNF